MARTKNNPLIYLTKKLIEEKDFQNKLNVISNFKFAHFEKWFQIELACFFEKNNCNHFRSFFWNRECKHEKSCVIPDFTVRFDDDDDVFYTEIKQYNRYITCLRNMSKDFIKMKDVIGTEKSANINCIGIFKTNTINGKKADLINEFKKQQYLIKKLNKLKIHNIIGTEYSLMYF